MVFGPLPTSELVQSRNGIRTRWGVGVAVVASAPVRVIPSDNMWGTSPHPEEIQARIVTAIATWGRNHVFVHSLYCQPNGPAKDTTNAALLDDSPEG